jgi:hypothetical protein
LFKGGAAILADSQNGDIIVLSQTRHPGSSAKKEFPSGKANKDYMLVKCW